VFVCCDRLAATHYIATPFGFPLFSQGRAPLLLQTSEEQTFVFPVEPLEPQLDRPWALLDLGSQGTGIGYCPI
jgi:hypothetical protein